MSPCVYAIKKAPAVVMAGVAGINSCDCLNKVIIAHSGTVAKSGKGLTYINHNGKGTPLADPLAKGRRL